MFHFSPASNRMPLVFVNVSRFSCLVLRTALYLLHYGAKQSVQVLVFESQKVQP